MSTSFHAIDKFSLILCDFFTGSRRVANVKVAAVKPLYCLTSVGQLRQFAASSANLTSRLNRPTA
ncbi:hypothetical protein EMIT0373P_40222 [Pseudomonas chlororaphis]